MSAIRRACGVLAVLAALAGPTRAAPATTVVSVVGQVRLGPEELPVEAGQTLPAAAQLVVPRGAAMQLLLSAPRLTIGACCGARLRLAQRVEIEGGAVRAAGQGGELAWGELRVTLDRAGSVVLLHERLLYCLAGQARVRYRQQELIAGPDSVSRVDENAHLVIRRGAPEAALLSRTLQYQPPAPWAPAVGELTLGQVRRVRQLVVEQQQGQRELAACGCTVSSASGAPGSVDGRTALTPVEQREIRLDVRLHGVPKRGP